MDKEAYSFKSSATYWAGGHFKEKAAVSLASQEIMVNNKDHFQAIFPDIFADYQNPSFTRSPVTSYKAWNSWKSTPFDWWQCQLNFALWCPTAGCGVCSDDHLLAGLYRFHVLLYDEASACGAKSRPPRGQVLFLVLERLRC